MSKIPSLSLCMLVKDEEDWIARCLNSVTDIADEIIIVDTGSSDRTVEICESFGAQVVPFSWNGNYSDACNVGLERATGDWILWLNADEQLDEIARSSLCANWDEKEYDAFFLPLITYYGESPATENTIQTSHVRLFRNHMGYRFIHPIYERLNIEELQKEERIGFFGIKIHQYRYLNSVMENKKTVKSRFDGGLDRTFLSLVQSLITKQDYIMSLHLLEKLEYIGLSNDWLGSMKGLSFMGIGLLPKAKTLLSNVPSSSLYYFPSLESLCIIAWFEEKFNEADMYVKQLETAAGHNGRAGTFRLLHQLFTANLVDDTEEIDMEVVHEVLCKLFELNGTKLLEQFILFVHKTGNTTIEKKFFELAGEFGYTPVNISPPEKLQENPLLYIEHLLSQQNDPKTRSLYKQILHHHPLQDDIRSKLAATILHELQQLLSTKAPLHPNLNNLYEAVTHLQSRFEVPFNRP